MLVRIALSAFCINFILPNSEGFIAKTAFYNTESYPLGTTFILVAMGQWLALISNHWIGAMLNTTPTIRRFFERNKGDFKKRGRQVEIFVICTMIISSFLFNTYIPYGAFFLGIIGTSSKRTAPYFLATATLQTINLIPKNLTF
jgi:hypothetical protein